MKEIEDFIALTFDLPDVRVLTARLDSDDRLVSTFMSDGHFCICAEQGGRAEMVRVDDATAEIQGYAMGYAESMGIRFDADNPYDSVMGYLRLDVKCSPGNKPCGRTCIPQRKECRVKGGGGMAVRQGRRQLGSPAKVAGGIAAGALGAAAAGGAAYVGVKSRKEIARGAKAIGAEAKRGAKEASGDIREGVRQAKETLKEGKRARQVSNAFTERNISAAKQGVKNASGKDAKKKARAGLRAAKNSAATMRTAISAGSGRQAGGQFGGGVAEGARSAGQSAKKIGALTRQTAKAAFRHAFKRNKDGNSGQEGEKPKNSVSNAASNLRRKLNR